MTRIVDSNIFFYFLQHYNLSCRRVYDLINLHAFIKGGIRVRGGQAGAVTCLLPAAVHPAPHLPLALLRCVLLHLVRAHSAKGQGQGQTAAKKKWVCREEGKNTRMEKYITLHDKVASLWPDCQCKPHRLHGTSWMQVT